MTLIRTAFRTVIVTAAASALVVGSAAGVMAKPATPKKAAKPTVVVKSVDIKRHSPINFLNTDSVRTLKVTARVKDSKKALTNATTVKVTLAQYTKRVRGDLVPAGITPISLDLTYKSGKTSKYFTGEVNFTTDPDGAAGPLAAPFDAIRTYLTTATTPTYLCLSTADVVGVDTEVLSTKMKKRLDLDGADADTLPDGKIKVGDCVKLIIKTPTA